MRKLVTLRKISNIEPIKDADLIEVVSVDGWKIVVEKGLYKKGSSVLFFEIDSFLPIEDPRFSTFMNFGTKTFEGKTGHKVSTKRIKSIYSQGIVLPIEFFPEIEKPVSDFDYAEKIGVLKYEKPDVEGDFGQSKGSFPWFLKTTDQERIQNIYDESFGDNDDFVGTLKLEGSSTTVYYYQEELGFCSRTIDLKISGENEKRGLYQRGIENSDLFTKVKKLYDLTGVHYAIQGELVGPSIRKNYEQFNKYKVFAFNIFNIDTQEYLNYQDFEKFCTLLDIEICPVIYKSHKILNENLDVILKMADGSGMYVKKREGIVWKSIKSNFQFKAISNNYLSK